MAAGSSTSPPADSSQIQAALTALQVASDADQITDGAVTNITAWLTEDRYAPYRETTLAHINDQNWKQLDDVFWTIIPFGTGGRRGKMYEIGSNAINDRTIGESAQGLASYVLDYHADHPDKKLTCAIAYDTRHRSRHFTELCAGIMVANGIDVMLLDDYRATPQLSFAVRELGCDCGIMVTASHNPPSDNAVKVYWSSGAQVLPPHDKAIIDRVMACQEIKVTPFDEALADGRVKIVTDQIDQAYLKAALACRFEGPRDLKVLYTPLHGVGELAVVPLMKADGFESVDVYEPHREPSGDFPNVPGHVSNPENVKVFEAPIEYAKQNGHELIMATDPDCDRLGVAAPITTDPSGQWGTFNGNQIAALLCSYVLEQSAQSNSLTSDSYVIKTLVTTELVRSIASAHDVRTVGELLVGYKHIAEAMDREGPEHFAYGCEESHGYLVGSYARDKDGAVACMLMAELAASLKSQGRSMHDYMADLYRQHGLHRENLINVFMEGSEGMAAMQRLMQSFREKPPESLGNINVGGVRDYLSQTRTQLTTGQSEPLPGPNGNLIIMDLEAAGNYVAVRPSGTEPKVKFYIFTRLNPEDSQDLTAADDVLSSRIADIESDLREYARLHS
ncbi:MAG: phospho-sugar mutase [Planctomycetota bacterium]